MVLDNRRHFYKHIEEVCARADAVIGAVRGLLSNVNGPSNACRKLYYQVWESAVLYASPVWRDASNKGKVVDELRSVQISALISTSTAYRAVSHAALCVLSGTMPIHIRARWRGRIFVARKSVRPDLQDPEGYSNELRMLEEEAVEAWKTEWSGYNTENWTRRLIEYATTFWKRKRSIDHYTMQLLTGHGIFNRYSVGINRKDEDVLGVRSEPG